jgi:uncharacterized heparinase superfamily protein
MRAAQESLRVFATPFHLAKAWEIAVPERLLLAPPDLRTADPTVAGEIYAGLYAFDGVVVHARGEAPFALDPPTPVWRRTLTGFSWLRHLRAAGTELARENARALTLDFAQGVAVSRCDPAFEPGVVARRLMSLLAHSPFQLDGADERFYDMFVELLAREARALHLALANPPADLVERLPLAVAFSQYCVCVGVTPAVSARATAFLAAAMERELLPDGGHASRNPQPLLELLLDMLPLRQAFSGRGFYPPEPLTRALDAMIRALRHIQHGDLTLALFNGMGETPLGRVATVLAQDDARRAARTEAARGGYCRLHAGEAVAIVDAGPPPPEIFARRAHAGCLSFEYSLGVDRVVVNCGAPPAHNVSAREVARSSSAHSTLTIDGFGSAQIDAAGCLVAGPQRVEAERRAAASGDVLELSHDGYAAAFGLAHERRLALTHDGARFIGEDRLRAVAGAAPRAEAHECIVRFHLHPRALAQFSPDAGNIEIVLASGAELVFEWSGAQASLEESVFFATASGGVKSRQIVLRAPARAGAELRWSFSRHDALA